MESATPPLFSVPFYLDWTFWAFAASAIAVVLSQLPPIRLWFSRGRIVMEAGTRVWVTHMLGFPNLQVYLNLRNVGGKAVRVKGIKFDLSLHGKPVAALMVQNFIANEQNPRPVVFTPFTLGPGGEWGYRATAFEALVAKDDRNVARLRRALGRNIGTKVRERDAKGEPKKLVVADDEVLGPLLEIFGRNFVLEAGEYAMTISVDTDTQKANLSLGYRFTLYEADSSELKSYVDDYKHGFGPVLDTEDHPGVICELYPK